MWWVHLPVNLYTVSDTDIPKIKLTVLIRTLCYAMYTNKLAENIKKILKIYKSIALCPVKLILL